MPDGSLDQAQAEDDPRKWTVPRLPDNVLSVLKECIEFSEDDQAKGLIDLVCQFQKQNRRLIDDIAMIRLNDVRRLLLWANIEESIVDAAELYARASVLFPFAKGKTNQIFDIKRNLIYNACFVSGCFETLEEIDRLADRWELGFPHRRKMEEMGLQSLGLSTVQVGEGSTARLPPI